MAITIRNNTVAVASVNRMNRAHAALQQSAGRISSGSRILRAGDDAAGSAMSANLRVEAHSARAAIGNINDAISINSASQGFLKTAQDILVRIRELAVQASSETVGDDERSYIDSEYDSLSSEMRRLVFIGKYNDIRIADGGTLTVQVGTGSSDTADEFDIKMGNVKTVQIVVGAQDLSSASRAQSAITHFDNSMGKLNLMRSTLGAQHNRLTSALSNAQDHTLSLKAAESRIFDTDFASETASMTAHQVKLAAGASAIAQANGLSRNVIDLI